MKDGDSSRSLTRRKLLRGVGAAGAVTVGAYTGLLGAVEGVRPLEEAGQAAVPPAVPRPAFEHLRGAEAQTLEAIIDRLIPTDDHGPGAKDARAIRFIDRALGGALLESRSKYAAGLAALDRAARAVGGAPFHQLTTADQDALLQQVERGDRTEFDGGSSSFFEMVRTHTLQGTFGDPYYGGNANFVGWDMIGYPGVRTLVRADDQRMSTPPMRVHKSAYDYEMFTKASASGDAGPIPSHGD